MLLIVIAASSISGCSANDAMIIAMQASFAGQFEAACAGNAKCLADLDEHEDACFDRTLAQEAIDTPATGKRGVNAAHIAKYQACISAKSGVNHWEGMDMADVILNQADR